MAAKEGTKKNPAKFINADGHLRDRIILHQTPEIPKEGAFISLNGFGFQVKPGVEVDIPRPVRLMMDTLFYTDIIQDEEGGEYTRNRLRYPYTLVQAGVNGPAPENAPLPGFEPKEAGANG